MRVLFYVRGMEYLGVGYLMSYLEQQGHSTGLLFDPGIDNNLFYRLPILKPFNRWDRLLKEAEEFSPDLVAVSAFTNVYPFALEFLRKLKKRIDAPVVFGGIHATVLPEYVLENKEIDYVVRGEGEETLAELVDKLEKGESVEDIRNLCLRKDGKSVCNPLRPLVEDLDSLPFPKRQPFFDVGANKSILYMMTSRGCPFACTYCHNSFLKNKLYKEIPGTVKYVRRRSPQNVIEEIRLRTAELPIKMVYFSDEIFTSSKKWLREFLELYGREFREIPFTFSYHHKFIDEEIADMLAAAGHPICTGAIECADVKIRREILKRSDDNGQIRRAAKILKSRGIPVSTCVIFGIPYETEDSRWQTVDLAEEIDPKMINSFLMYPFPGTEIAEIATKGGFLDEEGYERAKRGESSYHQKSLLSAPDIKNASTMAKLLPLYIKGPKAMRPILRYMMHKEIPTLAHGVYLASAPFVYSSFAREWVSDMFRSLLRSNTKKDGKSKIK